MRGLFLHERKWPNHTRSHPHPSPPPQAGEGARQTARSTDKCDESSTNISRSREMPRHEQREVPNHTSSRLTCGKLSERSASGAKRVLPQVFKARFGSPFARKQKVTPPPGGTPGLRPWNTQTGRESSRPKAGSTRSGQLKHRHALHMRRMREHIHHTRRFQTVARLVHQQASIAR